MLETGGQDTPALRARVVDERTLAISGLAPLELLAYLRRAGLGDIKLEGDVDGIAREQSSVLDLLSDRERAVVSLICRGMTNDEVAGRLFLSANTVKSYIRSAYRKMGVGTRSQAVLWGVSHGLDSDPLPQAPADDL